MLPSSSQVNVFFCNVAVIILLSLVRIGLLGCSQAFADWANGGVTAWRRYLPRGSSADVASQPCHWPGAYRGSNWPPCTSERHHRDGQSYLHGMYAAVVPRINHLFLIPSLLPLFVLQDIRPWGSMSTIIAHTFMAIQKRPRKCTSHVVALLWCVQL